ncbi:hypothetical protein [Niallia sp. 01092]|uniref:hypothetical protein n=1 Tax=unclassified Niallia TaxID=2837522 RepID=UPI003FCF6735
MKCCYPYCFEKASNTWALVPLCVHHYKSIKEETDKYYCLDKSKRIQYEHRDKYMMIVEQIPWSKVD